MNFRSRNNVARSRATALLLAATLGLGASMADAKRLLHNIELLWRPTSSVQATPGNTAETGLTVQLGQFGDTRDNKELIGENHEDADEGTVLPVSTVTNVPDWVAAHIKEVLLQNGVNVVDSGAPVVLDGDVQRFFVAETNTYQGNIVLHLRARDAAGTVLWETNLSASESRFGRSYKKENYCEVLSDTLINLVKGLLGNDRFRAALAGAAAAPAGANGPTATDPIIE